MDSCVNNNNNKQRKNRNKNKEKKKEVIPLAILSEINVLIATWMNETNSYESSVIIAKKIIQEIESIDKDFSKIKGPNFQDMIYVRGAKKDPKRQANTMEKIGGLFDLANSNDPSFGDVKNSTLATGDIARIDEDGFYYIIGRKKRFIKLAGSRYSLDEIENLLEDKFNSIFMALGDDDKLSIKFISLEIDQRQIFSFLQSKLYINQSFIKLERLQELPYTTNGKKDYLYFHTNES